MTRRCYHVRIFAAWTLVFAMVVVTRGQEVGPPAVQKDASSPEADPTEKVTDPMAVGEKLKLDGLVRLSKEDLIWIDPKRKLVVCQGKVCLRRGVLELFACPNGTKEHESIVSVDSKAWMVHTALLAIGAKQGAPVRFDPEYKAASGSVVDVWVLWRETKGKNRMVKAQDWIRNTKTEKAMTDDWVFAGSSFYIDEMTGMKYYQADGSGDMICVSNFSTAMMDLNVKSSADAASLLFEAFTERIPPLGTQVRLVLIPRSEPVKTAPMDDAKETKPVVDSSVPKSN